MNIRERDDFRGMYIQEYNDILFLINKHHRFGVMPKEEDRLSDNRMIKYIDTCFDTRCGTFWSIDFRGLRKTINFRTNLEIDVPFENLYEWVRAFLMCEWNDEEIIKKLEE